MKNILITGGSGYSGKNLGLFLYQNKTSVFSTYYRNKINKKNYISLNLLKKIKINLSFNWIIHTASHHKINDFKKKSVLKYENNIKMIKNLIDFSKKKNIKNFIFYSTFDINYPKKNKDKIAYINSKIKCEKLLISALSKGILKKLYILRLPAIIGKNSNSTFLVDVYKKIKNNTKIHIWNYHNSFNTIIHIDDLNRLIYYLINSKIYKKLLIIDCLSTKPLLLLNLIKIMIKKIKSKSKIILTCKEGLHNKPSLNKKINYNFYSVKKAALRLMDEY